MPLDFSKLNVEPRAFHRGCQGLNPSKHLLFTVENSIGRLRKVLYKVRGSEPPYVEYASVLQLGETALLCEQSSGCPTCESLLGAGYGIPASDPELLEAAARMNGCGTSWITGLGEEESRVGEERLVESLYRLKPVLGLLCPGLYMLSYSEYCPTDGEGHFFWDMQNDYRYYQATAQIYDSSNYRVLPDFPYYLCPTQPSEKFDEARMEYYRRRIREGAGVEPALAYHMDGGVSALLDGHHRAAACALEGICLPCLTISNPVCCRRLDAALEPGKEQEYSAYIMWPDSSETRAASVLAPEQVKQLQANPAGEWKELKAMPKTGSPFQKQWPPKFSEAAKAFPTCREAGALALYPYDELSVDGIAAFSAEESSDETETAADLFRYMCRRPGADRKACSMDMLRRNPPISLQLAACEMLCEIKGDEEIEDLFVNILVECEDKSDPLRRIAERYWD